MTSPHEALGIVPRQSPNKHDPGPSAADAADWMKNPDRPKRKSFAQLLIEDLEKNGPWTGPPYGSKENPAHEPPNNGQRTR